MKKSLTVFICLCLLTQGFSQCDPLVIDQINYSIEYVDSEQASTPASATIDGDLNTFWRTNGSDPFPHEIQINLGATEPVAGLMISPRQDNFNGKLLDYELYLSTDGQSWASPQAAGQIIYDDFEDQVAKSISFGAVDAQYVRLVGLSNYDPSGDATRLLVSELVVLKDTCGATGQANQIISFDAVNKQLTTDQSVDLVATASSGLPVSFEVIDGPATVQNSTLNFTGEGGWVTVKAYQEGDNDYYPTEAIQKIQLVNPQDHPPIISSRITENFAVEMSALHAYPLYASVSIEHDDLLEVGTLTFEVDGTTYETEREGSAYLLWWTPDDYGTHEVKIVGTSTDGAASEMVFQLDVVEPGSGQTITTFDHDLIAFGVAGAARWFNGTYELPQFVDAYDKITGHFAVECPNINGACDDWDRKAWVEVQGPSGNWIEIFRYITPYGVACDHTVDLTPYASLLQGQVNLRMFIDTWGTGGWDINLDIEYEAGTPDYLYSRVEELWDGVFDFGNPSNLQPVDTVRDYTFPEFSERAELILVTTGHGWGENNAFNAAEFFNATHQIKINNNDAFTQNLWVDCNPNPDGCQPQSGSWQFNRAGWCPGAIAEVYTYNLADYLNDGAIDFSYIFHPGYEDFCHPMSPGCVDVLTCPDCDAGFNPHYEVSGHIITYSNSPNVVSTQDLAIQPVDFSVRPNPNEGQFNLTLETVSDQIRVALYRADGQLIQQQIFANSDALENHLFALDLPTGLYFLQLETATQTGVRKLMIR